MSARMTRFWHGRERPVLREEAAMSFKSPMVILYVGDMHRALAFYGKGLGFRERFKSPGWSELVCGDTVIALHPGGRAAERHPHDGHQTTLSLEVEDAEDAAARVEAAGGSIVRVIEATPDVPANIALVKDTEGIGIELREYV